MRLTGECGAEWVPLRRITDFAADLIGMESDSNAATRRFERHCGERVNLDVYDTPPRRAEFVRPPAFSRRDFARVESRGTERRPALHRLSFRRSLAETPRLPALHRGVCNSGPRFYSGLLAFAGRPFLSQLLAGGLLGRRAEPRSSRIGACEARNGRPPLPPRSRRLMSAPLSGQGDRNIYLAQERVKGAGGR
jgi:hypothetical protein